MHGKRRQNGRMVIVERGKTGARNREKHYKCNKKQTNKNPFHLGNNKIWKKYHRR